ncbi:MAG: hypothetical protein FWE40_02005 [Oscillospiraceae bacterium]|nr:hypothetical protein [Oscillospiraceae bacterium]
MNQHTVLGQLRLLVELTDDEAHEALPFCAAATEQLLPKLKRDEDGQWFNRTDPRLSRAAACAALVMLLNRRENSEGDGVESFKAGDITVNKRGQAARDRLRIAITERDAAMADISELLRDNRWAFEAVRVAQ